MSLTPPIGAKGIYTLATPFDRLTDQGIEHTCMAIRRLSDYVAANEQPKDLIYTPSGIEAHYADDLKKDVNIVSLQSRKGHWVYIPEYFILDFPSGSGHRYRSVSIVLSMPPLPQALDLVPLQAELCTYVKSRLGVLPVSKAVDSSMATLVSDEKHIEVTIRRDAERSSAGIYLELEQLRRLSQAQADRIIELEAYIQNLPQ